MGTITFVGGRPLDLTDMAGQGERKAFDGFGGGGHTAGWYPIGYDAVQPKGRRKTPIGRVLSEDLELRDLSRRQLTTSLRDLNRNFAIAAWMIRRHLDYVATWHFRAKTGDTGWDKAIQEFMAWFALPGNCDPAGRHSLPRLLRMWEMRRTIDGDVLLNRLADGRIQTIEGDRIQTFGGIPFQELGIEDPSYVTNGVWRTEVGRAIGYMVFKRPPQWTGLLWDKMVPARFSDMLGYYDRYDQVRGISPLAAAANTLRDVYEGFDAALVKAKVTQFLGVIATRQASEELAEIEEKEGETDPNADPDKPRYDINLGAGPQFYDLDPGDKMEVIESKTPSTEFQSFSEIMIMVALKALDIPYCFYDEAHTNYAGSRMAGVQYYEAATKPKQHDLWMLLNKHTRWRLGLAIADGDVDFPQGKTAKDLKFEWSHGGVPLYDPLKEISAEVAGINAGMSSPQRACKRLGRDFFELVDEIAEAQNYAKTKGVTLSTALASVALDDPNKQTTKTEVQNEDDDKPTPKPGSKEAEDE